MSAPATNPYQITIGGTAVPIAGGAVPNSKYRNGVQLVAHPSNTGIIYFMLDSAANVTTAIGIPLSAGTPFFVPLGWFDTLGLAHDAQNIYAIASAAGQILSVLVL